MTSGEGFDDGNVWKREPPGYGTPSARFPDESGLVYKQRVRTPRREVLSRTGDSPSARLTWEWRVRRRQRLTEHSEFREQSSDGKVTRVGSRSADRRLQHLIDRTGRRDAAKMRQHD